MRASSLLALLLAASCQETVEVNPAAQAGCEAPTSDRLIARSSMLPGWDCQACHKAGGEAEDVAWTVAGTVFQDDAAAATCNAGGASGVKVEILDAMDKVLLTMSTNSAGNFYSAEKIAFGQYRARVSKNGVVETMPDLQTATSCNGCHNPSVNNNGRITLN